MVQIEGTYKLERNENLEEYFKTVGVPYFARKFMLASTPVLTVSREKEDEDEEETWVFKTVTFFRTVTLSFKLNEPYPEDMPSGDVLESTTTREGDFTFVTKSTHERIGDFERIYEFDDDSLIITMKHTKGVSAKRYFKREP